MAEFLFSWPFRLAALFWMLMILAPKRPWSHRIVSLPPSRHRRRPVIDTGATGTELGTAIGWTHFIGLDLFAAAGCTWTAEI